jgi:ketosteroid isomerase-like protein
MDATQLPALFAAIDQRDVSGFSQFLSPDAVFRFSAQPEVAGKAAVSAAVQGFFEAIAGIEHTLERSWELSDALVCEGQVTYTRLDGHRVTVPFANVLKLAPDGLIGEYRVYVDASALFRA